MCWPDRSPVRCVTFCGSSCAGFGQTMCRCLVLGCAILMAFCGRIAEAHTWKQVHAAIDVALMAVEGNLPEVSLVAARRAMEQGPPARPNPREKKLPVSTVRIVGDVSVPMEPSPDARILNLVSRWRNSGVDEVQIYETLAAIVMPPTPAQDVFLYAQPVRIDRLHPNEFPAVNSLAGELVTSAGLAKKLSDLQQRIAARSRNAGIQKHVLSAMVAVRARDTAAATESLSRLTHRLDYGISRSVATVAADAAWKCLETGIAHEAACEVMEHVGRLLLQLDSLEFDRHSAARAVLLAASQAYFLNQNPTKGTDLLQLYLSAPVRSIYSNSNHDGLQNRKKDVVAEELLARDLRDDATGILGDYVDVVRRRKSTHGKLTELPFTSAQHPAILPGATDASDAMISFFQYSVAEQKSHPLFHLPDFSSADAPSISSDGRYVAFHATLPGEPIPSGSRIYIADLNGSQLVDLTDGTLPSWSTDGRRLVFSRYTPARGIWTITTDGADERLIDEAGWGAVWSPDGRHIAYVQRSGDRSDIVVYNPRNETYQTVSYSFPNSTNPFSDISWSANSNALFLKTRTPDHVEIVHVGVKHPESTQPPTTVFRTQEDLRNFTMHPVQQLLACSGISGRSELIFTVETIDQAVPVAIEPQPRGRRNAGAAWMPHGNALIYISRPALR